MRAFKSTLGHAFVSVCIVLTSFCSAAEKPSPEFVLVASTPGDEPIKSKLAIPAETKVEFIRWELTLRDIQAPEDTFMLNINYGEGQPNTLGFKNGGEKRSIAGTYTITHSVNQTINGEIYHLKSAQLTAEIAFVKLSDNLFHLLTSDGELMIGNGGWSYSLNRKPLLKPAAGLPSLTKTITLFSDTARQVIFDGRTPCQPFASEHLVNVSSACFKKKWRIILNRDPVTHEPTTYTMRKIVDNEMKNVSGKWAITKGVAGNPNILIIRIDPGKGKETISLLVGDQNVLFLLDNNDRLYAGNSDFSYTLNKKP